MRVRAFLYLLLISCAATLPLPAGNGPVRITGVGTMKEFGERLTQWYANKNPNVSFNVASARSTDSFSTMANGNAEIVQSSRRVLHSEIEALRSAQGKKYIELQVATEIAGIAVNSANPVKDLSLFQLRQILSGSVKNWKQFGGPDALVTIYGRDDTSGVRAFLEEEFMGDESISSAAKTFPTNSAVLAAVGQDPNGIGFGTVDARPDPKVRFLGIKASANSEAVAPTSEAIHAKKYKLVRPLFFYFAGVPQGQLLAFAKWVLTPEGQLVVEAVGYYPLTANEREEGLQSLTGQQIVAVQ